MGDSETRRIVTASLKHAGRGSSRGRGACGELQNEAGERLLVVADGIQVEEGGAAASRLCVETVMRVFTESFDPPDERLRRGLIEANAILHRRSRFDDDMAGVRASAVAMIFEPHGPAWLAWVGDCRAYRFGSNRVQRLSQDHSLVSEWLRLGVISEHEEATHPRRGELLRSLGAEEDVRVEVHRVEVVPGDRFLLCSIPLCDRVSDADLHAELAIGAPSQALRRLKNRIAMADDAFDGVAAQIVSVGGAEGLRADDIVSPAAPPRRLRVPLPQLPPLRLPDLSRIPRPSPLVAASIAVSAALIAGGFWLLDSWTLGNVPTSAAVAPPAMEDRVAEVKQRVPSVARAQAPEPRKAPLSADLSLEAKSRRGSVPTPPDGSLELAPPPVSARAVELSDPIVIASRPEPERAPQRPAVSAAPKPVTPNPEPPPPRIARAPRSQPAPSPAPVAKARRRAAASPVLPEPVVRETVVRPQPAAPAARPAPVVPVPQPAAPAARPAPVVPVPQPAAPAARPAPVVQVVESEPAPPAVRTPRPEPPPVDLVRGFLETWERAVAEQDYEQYRELGLQLSAEQFDRSYVRRKDVALSFRLLEREEIEPGRLKLRIFMTYSYWDGTATRASERVRSIEVSATDGGLRYVRNLE